MIKEPPVRFAPWTPWAERGQVRNAHLPGVYLLAQSEERPGLPVEPLAREIVYVGEIADSSLMGRWQQFERAAAQGKAGHRGGLAYREIFGEDLSGLYVTAVVPEGLSRELRTVFIRYLAARLLWDWARKWEAEPLCNSR